MAIHIETISSQQVAVRRALKIILLQLDKDLYGIELRLVPIISLKKDEIMAARLKKVEIKHSQICSNIKTYEIEGIKNIDNLISPGSELTLRKLIMKIKTADEKSFAITITRNWRGPLEVWVKNKCKNMQV